METTVGEGEETVIIFIFAHELMKRHLMVSKPLAAAGAWPHLRCQNGRRRAVEMLCVHPRPTVMVAEDTASLRDWCNAYANLILFFL